MTGTGSFADIIKAVTDLWGLLALALLLVGLLAVQLTKGASPNLRVATFLIIFAGFLGSLYMAFVGGGAGGPEKSSAAVAGAPAPDDIDAQAKAAADYRESVDAAYGNAAEEMDEVARMIAGDEPAEEAKPADAE